MFVQLNLAIDLQNKVR